MNTFIKFSENFIKEFFQEFSLKILKNCFFEFHQGYLEDFSNFFFRNFSARIPSQISSNTSQKTIKILWGLLQGNFSKEFLQKSFHGPMILKNPTEILSESVLRNLLIGNSNSHWEISSGISEEIPTKKNLFGNCSSNSFKNIS